MKAIVYPTTAYPIFSGGKRLKNRFRRNVCSHIRDFSFPPI